MYISLPFSKRYGKINSGALRVVSKAPSHAEAMADRIIELYKAGGVEKSGAASLSHAAHMVQCAMLAMESLSDLTLIIGALLHNIGYLVTEKDPNETTAEAGAMFLQRCGFSERVCAIAAQQPAAKRYLAATTKAPKLMAAQGEGITIKEAIAFEEQPYFSDIVKVCRWSSEAKRSNTDLLPLSFFRKLLWDHLSRTTA